MRLFSTHHLIHVFSGVALASLCVTGSPGLVSNDINSTLPRVLNTSPHQPDMQLALVLASAVTLALPAAAQCEDYSKYSTKPQGTPSAGPLGLPFMRPPPECRSFNSSSVEVRWYRRYTLSLGLTPFAIEYDRTNESTSERSGRCASF
jgi:hypothetical protein